MPKLLSEPEPGFELSELDLQPGDVVRFVKGHNWWTVGKEYTVNDDCTIHDDNDHPWSYAPGCRFERVERAPVTLTITLTITLEA